MTTINMLAADVASIRREIGGVRRDIMLLRERMSHIGGGSGLPPLFSPSGGHVTAGLGLSGGGDVTDGCTIDMDIPGTLTVSTTNAVTSTSHTHELDLSGRIITAGDGLIDGGNLGSDVTIAMGTPSTLTIATTNTVTATSHTHEVDLSGRSIVAGDGLTDGGNLGSDVTVNLGTPGTLSVSTSNAVTVTSHAHAITSSSNPGAAASILASDASGYLQLQALGIGVTAPSEKLCVGVDFGALSGTRISVGESGAYSGFNWGEDANNRAFMLWHPTDDYAYMGTVAGGTIYSNVIVLRDGRAGIGTGAPDYLLDIAGNFGSNEYWYHNGDANTYVRFRTDRVTIAAGGIEMIDCVEGADDYVAILPSLSRSLLGVGTTDALTTWGASYSIVRLGTQTTLMNNPNSGWNGAYLVSNLYYDGSHWRRIEADRGAIYDQAGGEHRWRIVDTGSAGAPVTPTFVLEIDDECAEFSVGIGVDTSLSNWSSTWSVIQLGDQSGIANYPNAGLYMTSNLYYDGSDWRYIESDNATIHSSSRGYHRWGVINSGTAGDVIGTMLTMSLMTNGALFINETINTMMYGPGLTILQDGEYEILSLKNSDCNHPFSGETEADTFFRIYPGDVGTNRGSTPVLDGFTDGDAGTPGAGIWLSGNAYSADNTDTASSVGCVNLIGYETDGGTGRQAVAAGDNVVAIHNGSSCVAIFKGDGDLVLAGAVTENDWDKHNDLALLNGLRASMADRASLSHQFRAWADYARPILERTGVVLYNDEGPHFISMRGLQMLTIDALRQFAASAMEEVATLRERVSQLENVMG